jgi:hypothetical protein
MIKHKKLINLILIFFVLFIPHSISFAMDDLCSPIDLTPKDAKKYHIQISSKADSYGNLNFTIVFPESQDTFKFTSFELMKHTGERIELSTELKTIKENNQLKCDYLSIKMDELNSYWLNIYYKNAIDESCIKSFTIQQLESFLSK